MAVKDTTGAKPADAYHHGDLREALVNVALAKIEEFGPELSLAGVAKALGVSQAAPYRHFSDRDGLLAAVAVKGFKEFSAALVRARNRTSKRPALSRMAHAYVAFGIARPGLYRLMFASHVLPRAAVDSELSVSARDSFSLLVNALEEASAQIGERKAMKIWVGLHGIVMLATQNLLLGQPAAVTMDDLIQDILA